MDKRAPKVSFSPVFFQVVIFILGFGLWALVFFAIIAPSLKRTDYATNPDLTEWLMGNVGSGNQEAVDSLMQHILKELEEPQSHGAAPWAPDYQSVLGKLCRAYASYCSIVSLPSWLSEQDRFFYQGMSILILARLDRYLTSPHKIVDVLHKLALTTNGGRRGYAVKDSLTINLGSIKSYREYMEILIHELGHVVDLGVIAGSTSKKHETFTEFGNQVFSVDDPSLNFYRLSWDAESIRKASAGQMDFCSNYGQTNTFEDFSECFNLFLTHNALFRYFATRSEVMKKKYNFLAEQLGAKYFFDGEDDLLLVKANPNLVFFDTTKIP